jgi:Restriction endonuclease fold toxin 5
MGGLARRGVGLIDDLIRLFRGPMPPIPVPVPVPIPVPVPTLPRRLPEEDPNPGPKPRPQPPFLPPLPDRRCRTCEDCPPRKNGHNYLRTLTGTENSRTSGAVYQHFVVPWFQYNGAQIEEWMFSGVSFDGLHPSRCQLIEAKGRYGFLFVNPNGLRPDVHPWADGAVRTLKAEFQRQYYALTPYGTKTELLWVIHTWLLWLTMSEYINGFTPSPFSSAEQRVYPGWNPND